MILFNIFVNRRRDSKWHTCFVIHYDVIKWKHFLRYWPFVRGLHRSPVNSPHKGQWRGALMFTLICTRINDWVNNREAGDLRPNRAHYGVIVMKIETHLMYSICRQDRLFPPTCIQIYFGRVSLHVYSILYSELNLDEFRCELMVDIIDYLHFYSILNSETNLDKFRSDSLFDVSIMPEVFHKWIIYITQTVIRYGVIFWILMMTSSNGNIFHVTGHLCGDFTGGTKACDAELWCFLWSAPD